jgi:hypothetical protein
MTDEEVKHLETLCEEIANGNIVAAYLHPQDREELVERWPGVAEMFAAAEMQTFANEGVERGTIILRAKGGFLGYDGTAILHLAGVH